MKHGKLPWRIWTGGKRKMSAILDADGNLVAGSLINQQHEAKTIANHKLIVDAVNNMRPRLNTKMLKSLGFDRSFYDRSADVYRVNCSCCNPVVIQGHPCHERGCPNQNKS